MAWVTRTLTQTRAYTDTPFYEPSEEFLAAVKTYTDSGRSGSVVYSISEDQMVKTTVLSFYSEEAFDDYKANEAIQAEYTRRQTYCSDNNITENVVQS